MLLQSLLALHSAAAWPFHGRAGRATLPPFAFCIHTVQRTTPQSDHGTSGHPLTPPSDRGTRATPVDYIHTVRHRPPQSHLGATMRSPAAQFQASRAGVRFAFCIHLVQRTLPQSLFDSVSASKLMSRAVLRSSPAFCIDMVQHAMPQSLHDVNGAWHHAGRPSAPERMA